MVGTTGTERQPPCGHRELSLSMGEHETSGSTPLYPAGHPDALGLRRSQLRRRAGWRPCDHFTDDGSRRRLVLGGPGAGTGPLCGCGYPPASLIRPAMSTLPIRRTTTRFPTPTSPTSSSSGSDAHSPTSRCCVIRSIVEFVGKGEFRIGSGRGTDGRFERVSFQEPVSAEDVMFEADVYLLTRGLAKRLRSRLLRNQRRRRDRKLVRRDPAAARRVQDRNRTLRRVRNLRHRPSRRHGRRSASTVTSRPTEHDSCRSSARAAT